MRVLPVLPLIVLLLGGGQPPAGPTSPVSATPAVTAYRLPLDGAAVVIRGFENPGRYEAGHRGVDLAAAPGTTVFSAGAGRVRFAGMVAGRGVVVVQHPDGIRTEYEPLAFVVRAGQVVRAGVPLGVVDGAHLSCAPTFCLHWGAQRGDDYLDPMSLLRPLGPVRLLPWPARPPPRA